MLGRCSITLCLVGSATVMATVANKRKVLSLHDKATIIDVIANGCKNCCHEFGVRRKIFHYRFRRIYKYVTITVSGNLCVSQHSLLASEALSCFI